MMLDHRASHTFELGNEQLRTAQTEQPVHHMLHHTKNIGNLSIIAYDKFFGSVIDASKIPAFVLPPAKEAKKD